MTECYVLNVGRNFEPEPEEPVMKSLFQQYERVIVESLISSFGLDFLVKDQYGGDVDTIHNVRQIGTDENMHYKNAGNQKAYAERGAYNSAEYHKDSRYIAKNREVSAQRKAGTLVDAYTGERIAPNGKSDLDHVISANEIHNDPGRVLAGLSGTDLANSKENLQPTNPHTNRTKKADTMEDFIEKYGDEYTETQKTNMRGKDAASRKAYEKELQRYYTSPKFAKDMTKAAGAVGLKMGARQALGFVFAEMWLSVKEEFEGVRVLARFDIQDFFTSLGNGLKKGFERAKEKYAELFSRFLSGAVAGALSSLTTTLCNIFFTTAKNAVKILRQTWASLVEAAKVLFINPENYTFGERMLAVAKILATGASVVVGVLVSEAVNDSTLGKIPVLGDAVQAFCGALVTGIMSCSLLYILDRNETVQKLVKFLDNLPTIEGDIQYFRQQAAYFEQYAAELMRIDLSQFQKETAVYTHVADTLSAAATEEELNTVLKNAMTALGIPLPWSKSGHDSFDSFMKDKNARLVFE